MSTWLGARSWPCSMAWCTLLVLALAFVCTPAWGLPPETVSPEEKSAAREAATAGIHAFQQGEYARALDLLRKAEQIVHAPPHLIYIARAHAAQGEFVLAREALILLVNEELPEDAPTAFRDAQAAGQALKAEIEPKIGRLSIHVQGATGPVVVTVDGKVVPEAIVGLPYPVDPGVRTVVVTSNGEVGDEVFVTIAEGQSEEVTLELTAPPEPAAPPPQVTAPPPPPPPEEPPPEPRRTTNPLVFVGFGTAAAGVLVGAVTGSISLAQTTSARNEYCIASSCDPAAGPALAEANTLANVSNVAFAIAAAGVGVGVYGLLSPSKAKASAPASRSKAPQGRFAVSPYGVRADLTWLF